MITYTKQSRADETEKSFQICEKGVKFKVESGTVSVSFFFFAKRK